MIGYRVTRKTTSDFVLLAVAEVATVTGRQVEELLGAYGTEELVRIFPDGTRVEALKLSREWLSPAGTNGKPKNSNQNDVLAVSAVG